MPSRLATVVRKVFAAPEQKQLTSSLAYPDAWTLELFGSFPSIAGPVVGPEAAMRCTPVRCAVQAIAEALGQLPVHLFDVDPATGVRTRDLASPIAALLNGAACEWMPGPKLREQVTRDALLWPQGGFAFINRLESGRIAEITHVRPAAMVVNYDTFSGEPSYAINGKPVATADIIHIHGPVVDLRPESPTLQAKEAIGLALVMEGHAARLFKNGAKPSGILSLVGNIGDEAKKNVARVVKMLHSGENSGGTAIFDGETKLQTLAFSSVDAQFLELRKFAIEEIARAFRVPPVLLMEFGHATLNNSEEMGRQFVTYCLLPWMTQWEAEISLKLVAPEDRATTAAAFDVDGLLRADLLQRAQAYQALIGARVLNPNECRARENLPPVPDGEAFLNPAITPDPIHQ